MVWGVSLQPTSDVLFTHGYGGTHPYPSTHSFLPSASGAAYCHKCHLTQPFELAQNCFALRKLIHKDVRVERNADKGTTFWAWCRMSSKPKPGSLLGLCFKIFFGHWLWMNTTSNLSRKWCFPRNGCSILRTLQGTWQVQMYTDMLVLS